MAGDIKSHRPFPHYARANTYIYYDYLNALNTVKLLKANILFSNCNVVVYCRQSLMTTQIKVEKKTLKFGS